MRHLLELVALDDVADLILAEVAKLDAALETAAHFLHVILKTAQSRKPAIINRLTPTQNPRPRSAADPAVDNKSAGDNAATELENLFHFCMTNDRFAMLRFE